MAEKNIFSDAPMGKAVRTMIFPTIISQIIMVIYNMADTWYVGLTGNAYAVAAVSLCLPVYSILSAVSNLFGIGGAGVLARALGVNDKRKARKTVQLTLLGAVAGAVIYAVFIAAAGRPLLMLIGGDENTIDYAVSYVLWTIAAGGIPTIVSPVCGHLIRAMGRPKAASFGMILGAVLNIFLDPLFMFVLLTPGREVQGAAMATALSNVFALVYFVVYLVFFRKNPNSIWREAEKETVRKLDRSNKRLLGEIVTGGIPGFCMVALAMVSNCILNSMISSMGSEAVGGLGIVRKIDQLAYAVNQGITQGMLPLAAYCYSAGLMKRMWKAVRLSALYSEGFSLICTAVSLLFSRQLITFFIRDEQTVYFGSEFLRVLCLAIPIYTITFIIIAAFQAMGRGLEPFILSVLHKGSLDILLLFVIRSFFGVERLVWAAPVSESVALVVGLVMINAVNKKLEK